MKNRNILTYTTLSMLFMVCAYVFWAIPYRSLLSYHEQFQLFLLSADYLTDHLAWPGGMVTYIAEFMVQTFNNYWIGAAVMAIALTSIQLLTWQITGRYTRGCGLLRYVLSFLPALAMWIWLGDVNSMFSIVIAVIVILLTFWTFTFIHNRVWRVTYIVIGIPLVYWLAGASVYLFAALVCIDILKHHGTAYLKGALCVMVIAYSLCLAVISSQFINFPAYQLMIGINYYRIPVTLTPMMVIAPLVTLLVIGVCAVLPAARLSEMKAYKIAVLGSLAFTIIIGYAGINKSFDPLVHELLDYDYLIRTNRWDEILQRSRLKSPNTPMSLCATNLALGMTNQLNTLPFGFNQHGVAGLIPAFQRDANSSLLTAEIFFQLGMVNSAQRLMFEAMESITNYNKSSRCMKRLAETNIIRGDYAVAQKYLKILGKTMFYRKWAQRMSELIKNPGTIDTHPLYGRLRRMQIDDTFLFSEPEIDKILGQLYIANHDNALAKQYLMLYPLLQRDIDKFMKYLQVVQDAEPYRPLLCQQAVAFAYVKAGMEVPPGIVDANVLQQLREFAQAYSAHGKDSHALDRFKDTLWYYLTVSE